MDPLSCGWDAAQYLIFSENVFAPLIYYSHLGPLLVSLLIGVAVLFNNPSATINRTLAVLSGAFALWVYFDLILWASEKQEFIMFFWSAIVPVELLIYAAGWYLVCVLANHGSQPSNFEKIVAAISFVPIFLLAHTSYNLLGYDLTNCDRAAIEGPLIQYLYIVELLFILWTVAILVGGYRRMQNTAERTQLLTVGLGVIIFLSIFTAGNITLIFELDWSYEQYKLFGMPILVGFITYSAIRFKTFDLKIFTAQALVIATSILVLSLLFIRTIENVRLVTIVTFFLIAVLGLILIRNVRREIEQRELIQIQEQKLEAINQQQESLLHFISHEVKGFLTEGQNAFAGIVEGDFGKPPEKVRGVAQIALGKMRSGVSTVMDILDASNLKKGTMQYKLAPFDLKQAITTVTQDLTIAASAKGITIETSLAEGDFKIEGDEEKMKRHVIRNLVDNSIKYTPQGNILVSLTRTGNMMRFEVKDSGVGITTEDMKHLFTEGGHGKDSIKTNVNSTSYGLFVAKSVVDAHKGKIWAESDGQGKGSTFVVELPAT